MRCTHMACWSVKNTLEIALLLLATAGCSSSRDTPANVAAERTDPSNAMQDAGAPRTAASSSASAATTPTICEVGSTRSCCGSGTQTCRRLELNDWGPCLAQSGMPLSCVTCGDHACDAGQTVRDAGQVRHDAGHDSDLDAGVMPDAGHSCGPGMECKPGSIRYCDESLIAEWTVSSCSAQGRWGACVAATIPAELDGVGDCTATSFSPESCCPQRQVCCQDGSGGIFEPFGGDACAALSCPTPAR